jgi:uncharacterized membrane protein YsdA (DUF1294 family)
MIALNTIADNIKYVYIGWLLLWSLILFILMGRDKRLSKTHRRRIPEATLFFLGCLGGAMGGSIGMQVFHHKTKHLKFSVGFPLIMLLQWGLVIFMLFSNPTRGWFSVHT